MNTVLGLQVAMSKLLEKRENGRNKLEASVLLLQQMQGLKIVTESEELTNDCNGILEVGLLRLSQHPDGPFDKSEKILDSRIYVSTYNFMEKLMKTASDQDRFWIGEDSREFNCTFGDMKKDEAFIYAGEDPSIESLKVTKNRSSAKRIGGVALGLRREDPVQRVRIAKIR